MLPSHIYPVILRQARLQAASASVSGNLDNVRTLGAGLAPQDIKSDWTLQSL